MTASPDPLGRQPRPTGRRDPDWSDPLLPQRIADANVAFKTIWVEEADQTAIIGELKAYRLECLGKLGKALYGRRLSQLSNAGKSATMERLKTVLGEERLAAGLPANEHQVIHVTIDSRLTLRQFYQLVLRQLGDDFFDEPKTGRAAHIADKRDIPLLEQRIAHLVRLRGTELIVIDEAQRLDRKAEDAIDVTVRIQTWLDRGVAALVLVGDENSTAFFNKNLKLRTRLKTPLVLRPIADDDGGRERFMKICASFDEELVRTNATRMSSDLTAFRTLEALFATSGGHVGRLSRLLAEALEVATKRGSPRIEPFDLSCATRDYAIGNGWIDRDPFSKKRA